MVCGGTVGGRSQSHSWHFDVRGGSWKKAGGMENGRGYNAAFQQRKGIGLVASGGFNGHQQTEITSDVIHFSNLPAMPGGKFNHGIAVLRNADFVVIGGSSESTFLYEKAKGTWTTLPDIPATTYRPICGVIENARGEEEVIVGDVYGKVHILNMSMRRWRTGNCILAASAAPPC